VEDDVAGGWRLMAVVGGGWQLTKAILQEFSLGGFSHNSLTAVSTYSAVQIVVNRDGCVTRRRERNLATYVFKKDEECQTNA
jgi:hypothetical protein